MPAFEYQALDSSGRTKKGLQEGDSPRQVRQKLRERGYTPLQVTQAAQRKAGAARRLAREHLGARELALATRQLATLVRAGLPLAEALSAVAEQTAKRAGQRLLLTVRARVVEGRSLADALASAPRQFPDFYRASVGAGEQSGNLATVLEHLADTLEARRNLRQKTLTALIYPSVVGLVALGVVAALLVYVVPQVVQVFAALDQQLPWITRALIATGEAVRAYGLHALVLLAAGLGVLAAALRRPAVAFRADGVLLRVPGLGPLVRAYNAARFARTFAIVASAGVPALEGLRIAAGTVGNRVMRSALHTAAERVREGRSLAQALQDSGALPPMILHLAANGEASGNLAPLLGRAADNQERELAATINAALAVFEPLLILVLGGLVLVIVVAIMLPVYELNSMVG